MGRLTALFATLLLGMASSGQSQQGLPRDLIVRGLSFKGNHAINGYTLGISIATSNSSWAATWPVFRTLDFLGEKRYFDETEFRRDVLRIQALYRLSGFLEAKVDTVVHRTRKDVHIQFIITEGTPIRVTRLLVSGAETAVPTKEIVQHLPLREGKPFSRFLLRASADTIRTILQNSGYPFVEVYSGYDLDSAARSAEVTYTVDPGKLARISAVAVTGARQIQPSVVRRAVGLRSGQKFSQAALAETQRNLYRTDLFTYVSVSLVDSVRNSPDDSLVAIQVQVNEGKLRVVRAGAGYGALDCFRGIAGWTGRNFFGGGRSLDVSARLSKVGTQLCPGLISDKDSVRRALNYELAATFREPFLFTRSTSGALSFFAERHSEVNTFTRISRGGELTVTQLFGLNSPVNFTYDLSSGRTIADPAIYCTLLNVCQLEDTIFSARRRESTLGAGINWNRANSVMDPSRGTVLSVQLRYAAPLIGSDDQRQFTRGSLELAAYHSLGLRTVFAWRVRLGALLPAQLGFLAATKRFVPPDERFYLGGPNTVRGYGQNELGPLVRVRTRKPLQNSEGKDSVVNGVVVEDTLYRASPTGGDRVVLGNAELRFPIYQRLSGALFVDVGEIYGGEPRAPAEVLHVTPGIGLRFATPIGPIRVDVGYNPQDPTPSPLYEAVPPELRKVEDAFRPTQKWSDRFHVHLSVGQPF
ncbi:MAG: BamA/TamA family outer membrane protein [Gemmatimonadetes bacterium]|nr:BamA/TamA family outer membrane protein [Gemmatimonadota bacterium]